MNTSTTTRPAAVHDLARRTAMPLDLVTGIYWPTNRLPVQASPIIRPFQEA